MLSSVPVPRVVLPSMKVTIPVGIPLPADDTLAVRVIGWPYSGVVVVAFSAVVVFVKPLLTDWTTLPLLPVKLPSLP